MWGYRMLSAGLVAVLAVSLAGSAGAAPAAPIPILPPEVQEERLVPVAPVPVLPAAPDAAGAAALRARWAVSWPSAGAVEVTLPAAASLGAAAAPRPAGNLPVRLAPAASTAPAAAPTAAAGAPPATVRVEVLDRAATRAAGVAGLVLRLRRTDGVARPGPVSVSVDYGGFRHAYGGDWAQRLRFVRLDGTALPSRNDARFGTVIAELDVSATDTDLALAAGPSGANGTYAATPLALSSSWQASGQTGDFSWNYPLRMPETPGNLAPQLSISYSSGAVDGRTASTNNQPSWVGEGFDLWSGYIERSYKGCADDLGGNNGQTKTGDQCWFSDNATMSLSGHSGQLVRDDASWVWRLEKDDGSRIEKLTGAVNGDNDGEYWRVTTRDGIQYFFGLNRLPNWAAGKAETQSAWTAPVFGNHPNDPCRGATYAASWCYQAYRWNLDHVVDPRGNSIAYYYAKDRNSYGLDMGKQTVGYDRGGVLQRADFGTRRGTELDGTAPARVVFTTADRCLSNCTVHGPGSYPDVPFDQQCGANCTNQVSPTFWTTKRLASITTQVGTTPAETWSLNHSFPLPGDGTSPGLWLTGINHSGVYGGSAALPAVTFAGEAKANRVNSTADGLQPLNKYRIISVSNEFGGVIGVNYAPTNCVAGALPAPENNTLRCFPVYWQPDGAQPLTDWMHKYVVASVVQVDRVGGSPTEATFYDYHGGGAWRYADNELVNPDRRTWSQWRGYQKVTIRHGAPGTPQSATDYLYFRGMDGDRLAPAGGTRPVSIVDSQGGQVTDADQFNGVVREKVTYNGNGGPVLGGTINDVWQQGPTATRGALKAFMVETGAVHERVALTGGGWRRTQINRSYNTDGLVTQIDKRGDLAVTGDEECSRTWYVRDEPAWLLGLPSRVEAVAVPCASTPVYPADTISDVRTQYDTVGNPTRVEQVSDYPDGQPAYTTVTRATFDAYGRPLDTFDALDRKSSTRYTETAGLTTTMTATNALGHLITTELSPAWGEPTKLVDANGRRTDIRYDPLGRVTGVWLPGRSEPAGEGPNLRYTYQIRNTGPSAITTESLRANNNYATTYALYDGFLRPRQTQASAWTHPTVPGGRVITDTVYDSRGLQAKVNGRYFADGAPGTTLVAAGDNNIPSQTVNVYDGATRVTVSTLLSMGQEQWHSTTAYHGDRTDHKPPAGGTATTVELDAEGRTTALHQYRGPDPGGPADVTRYTYTNTGQLATVTDPAGNQWRYGYDLRGRRISAHDPDKGAATSTYDAAGQLLMATDARGIKLAFGYDAVGRKIEERDGSPTGTLRARWTYDTLLKGLPTARTRIDNGNPYTVAVVGYDTANRPTGTKVTIPAVEGALAGTYQTDLTYRPDGSVASMALPRAGDLAPETVTYGYDEFGMPKTTRGASTYVDDTWYTRFGELAQVTMGAPGIKLWHNLYYAQQNRRLDRSLVKREKTTGAFVNDFRYEYDPAGNVTRIADVPEGEPADIQCFRHDHLRRLTEGWSSAGVCTPGTVGGAVPYRTSYVYDLTGNRTGETQYGTGGAGNTTRTYRYTGPGHALSSVTTTSPSGSTVDSFGYDAIGNTTSRNLSGATQTLTWDAAGRLSAARAADGTDTTITYGADGARLLRREPTATTLYLGAQEIRWDRRTNAKTGTRFYPHGGVSVGVRTASGLHWQAGDHHGTATTVVRSDTLAVTRRLFTPFGDTRGAPPAAWPDEHAFVGGVRDDSLGLTQLGAREYDTRTGRFLSVDPVIDPADPQQLNGYAYGNNSPATYSDPDGLFPDCGCESDRYGYDNVLHNADGSLLSESDANKYLNTQQKDKWKKKVVRKAERDQERRNWERKVRSTGHSTKDYDEAQKIKQRSVFDVAIEAGGEILKEFLGINDIKGCFGDGDLGSCISMVINIIPWTKIFRLGELISSVKKAWNAVMGFRDKQKWADNVVNAVDTAAKSCHSFRRDTKVRMADGGYKSINAIKLGDKVLATDPKTKKSEPREVVALHVNADTKFADVTVTGGSTLHTTENHPFWSASEAGWVDAGELAAGDRLLTAENRLVAVAGVHRYGGEQVMYDLTVDGTHTYFVNAGGDDALVHNNNGACPVHPVAGRPDIADPDAKGPCTCPGGSEAKGAGERHPGEGQQERQASSVADVAGQVQEASDYAAHGGDITVPLAVMAAGVAGAVRHVGQRIRNWWRRK